ncbi:MAG TPA: tRNA lysidine(34) synthetase TilS, partial [Chthonomonadaceae bacterium]|nr:tRNA lysidine(34) synthetase TilS [Chthonomonadaceae bacterium]
MDPLLELLKTTVARYTMLSPGQTVVVGVSGGPDSTALLHALAHLRAEWDVRLVAAHLHHGFRGAEAEEDARYVVELAQALAIPCRIERADVPAMRRRMHLSAQEAARRVRHAFLRRVAADVDAQRIALGHTRDDRIETILLNLFRGTGPEGLAGFPPVALPVVRPLYEVSRAEIEAYCQAHGLQPRRDSSNLNLEYRRNRLRTELLPTLASYFNVKVGDAVLRMAGLVSADNEFLEERAAEALEQVCLARSDAEITLDAQVLQALQAALQRRVLRQAVAKLRGHLREIGFNLLEQALEAVRAGETRQFALPADGAQGIFLRVEASTLRLSIEPAPAEGCPWQQMLQVPGRTEIAPAGIAITARICPAAGLEPEDRLVFRLESLALPILARSWRPGDRMRPRGLDGSKKLQDLFTDRKIPRA